MIVMQVSMHATYAESESLCWKIKPKNEKFSNELQRLIQLKLSGSV